MHHAHINSKSRAGTPAFPQNHEINGTEVIAQILHVTDPEGQDRPWESSALLEKQGPALSVWKSLSREKNSRLFVEDLYHLGRSYERSNRMELAGRIYAWVESQQAKFPEAAEQARKRRVLMAGGGRFSERVELFLHHSVEELSAPDLWMAMGAAGFASGLGAKLGFRLTGAWGWSRPAAQWFGSAMSLAAEATAFTGVQEGAALLLHDGKLPTLSEWGHHWISAAMMIGILRGCHWGASAAKLPPSGILNQAGLHASQYLGLWTHAYLRQRLGWDEATDLSRLSAQVLAQWGTFHVAGRLGRNLFGSLLGTPTLAHAEPNTPRLSRSALEGLQWAVPAGAGDLTPAFAIKAGTGKGPARSPSLPDWQAIRNRFPRPLSDSGPQAFSEAETLIQWVRSMMSQKTAFRDILEAQNFQVKLQSRFGWNTEVVSELLNELPRMGEIPQGRSLRFKIRGQNEVQEWIKGPDGFQDVRQSLLSPSSEIQTVIDRNSEPPSPISPGLRLRTSAERPESGPTLNQLWLPEHLPLFMENLERLGVHLKRLPKVFPNGERPSLIVTGRSLTLEALREATPSGRCGMEEGQTWNLMVPQNNMLHRVFVGQVRKEGIVWRLGESTDWERVNHQALFANPVVRSPLEAYQLIDSIGRDPSRDPKAESRIKHRGMLTYSYLQGLDAMISSQLRSRIPGKGISFVDEWDRPLLEYGRHGIVWVRQFRADPELMAPEAVPEMPPPARSPSASVEPPVRAKVDLPKRLDSSPPGTLFQIANIPTDLLQQMRSWAQSPQAKYPLEVMLRYNRPLNGRDVEKTQERMIQLNPKGIFILHDTQSFRTLSFRSDGSVERVPWSQPRSLDPLWVQSPTDLLRSLAMIQNQAASASGVLRIKVRGLWKAGELPPPLLQGLDSFRSLPYNRLEFSWPLGGQSKVLVRTHLRLWQEQSL